MTVSIIHQGCSPFESVTTSVSSIDALSGAFSTINNDIIQARCVSCHSSVLPSGGVDLSNYQSITTSGTVVPNGPLQSRLYTEIFNGDMPPKPEEPLSPLEIERVRVWISNGALENERPVVSAGEDLSVLSSVSSLTLTAIATDVEGAIVSYQWIQNSGPAGLVLSGSTTPNLLVSNLNAGSYTFTVTVMDSFGDTAFDTINLSVTDAPNQAPSVDAGMDQLIITPTNSTSLMSIASDADGTIASYNWVQISGPISATLSGVSTSTLNVSDLIEGVYTFVIEVIDNDGATASDQVQVSVEPPTPSYSALKANIFDAKCGRCHMNGSTSGGYDMDTWAETIVEVVTGEPLMSDLYLRTSNETMPPRNAPESPLTLQELSDLKLWIERGAPNN